MKTCPQCKMRYPNEATYCFVEGSDLLTLQDARIGTLLAGRYVIEEVIGEGGMASVYRARHKLTEKQVAVKIMNPLLASDPVVRERFRREARSAQKLAHPNIIEIFDQGDTEDGHTAFIVMELLRGESLAPVIARGPLEVDRAIHVMIQIARGVARAHDLEIIHRDIKPENIFLSRREDGSDLVKVLDFGIAKSRQDSRLTNQGELFGTPQYMAPERIKGEDSGGSSDIYALGIVFFEMLTGELPFNAPDVAMFFVKHMEEPPPPVRSLNARVPEKLDDLVQRMLAKAPSDRPVDAHRVHQDLLDIIKEREALAPPSAEDDQVLSSAPVTLAAGPADLWARRVFVLEQMLSKAYGAKARAPGELTKLLEQANGLVRRVVDLRLESFKAQESLEQIDGKGREKRAQLGFAVDQLGVDGSKAKEDLRTAREHLRHCEEGAKAARERYEGAHKEALFWEGRCGFLEPTTDLALAYRAIADAVDEWVALKQEARKTQEAADTAERLANDLDFQLRELRNALTKHETELDGARDKCESVIPQQGREADRIEIELYDLMTRFCQPLRTRPELAPLFKELETEAAA